MVGDRSMRYVVAGEHTEHDMVSCVICDAQYASAARTQDTAHRLSPLALESALMSMCHFCFCCRRPSCPYCWDEEHGVCAQCAQEARLPFRKASPPLSGMLFAPPRKQQVQRGGQVAHPLICVQPGNIQYAALSIDIVTTRPQISAVTVPGRRVAQPHRQLQAPAQQTVSQIEQTVPDKNEVQEEEDDVLSALQLAPARRERLSVIQIIERILTIVLLLVLAVIVALILIAVYSEEANTFIAETLRIDIRTELMYLWMMLRGLHW